jgi:hypothetical protein
LDSIQPLDEVVELGCHLEDFVSFAVRSDMGARVVDHVSLSTPRLEVIRIPLSAVADGEGDRVDGHPVMASLRRDAVAGAGNRYARSAAVRTTAAWTAARRTLRDFATWRTESRHRPPVAFRLERCSILRRHTHRRDLSAYAAKPAEAVLPGATLPTDTGARSPATLSRATRASPLFSSPSFLDPRKRSRGAGLSLVTYSSSVMLVGAHREQHVRSCCDGHLACPLLYRRCMASLATVVGLKEGWCHAYPDPPRHNRSPQD